MATVDDPHFSASRLAPTVRAAILEAMTELLAGRKASETALLLSGGLDTSIVASAARIVGVPFTRAVTIKVGSAPPDWEYSSAIGSVEGLALDVFDVADARTLVAPESPHLAACVRRLHSFDPMELRGGVALAGAIDLAAKNGVRVLVTGDGADELFAGYNFLLGLPDIRMRKWIRRIAGNYSFAAGPLAAPHGITVIQPFLHPKVVKAALMCKKADLVGPDPADPSLIHGKLVLREAFPEAYSRWRRKIPLETGAGTTPLGKDFVDATDADALKRDIDDIYNKYGIVIRDAEHLCYFRVFESQYCVVSSTPSGSTSTSAESATKNEVDQELFAHNKNASTYSWSSPIPRFGSDPCAKCGFQLDRPDQYFCKTCGAWPSRPGPIPQDSDTDDF
ncbi:hypothetical protein HDU79_009199 [Rhizoclosmatium sp. JEL0117]|nr:hypothetical protein HDU79_009199 [Rhizoclosmatium sp. JEL0117]